MAAVQKIDSNATGLKYSEELSIGVVDPSAVWKALEPNSYSDFGGEISTVARNPINESRQRKKGVTVDLDSSGGFNTDWTQNNLEDLLQGYFFADLRRKGEEVPTAATGTTDLFDVASTTGFQVDDLVKSTGWDDAANNLTDEPVTAVVSDTTVEVLGASLVTDGSPAAGVNLVVVGHQGQAGDIDVDASGTLPVLTSTILDFTSLGLIPGEWIFIGGDLAAQAFSNSVNNGFARIKSITAQALTLDKTQSTMVTEASTTETVRLYFGRVLKNENTTALIKRRTYQLERTLGAPDDASPGDIHAEYIEGAVPSEITFNFSVADKITADLSFVGIDNTQIDGPTALKAGTRPALVSEDAYNTSNDFSRLKMSIIDPVDSNPTKLFAFLTEFTLAINNNVSPNKAVSVLGAFDVTAGQFTVEGTATAYFADVAAVSAVRNNADVTLDFAMSKNNVGIVVDIPLIALGDARLNVEQDAPINLPLEMPAAADRTFDHTLLMVFFDRLPDLANT